MEVAELLSKVRRIEIKTRRACSQLFSGEYHSAFKGQGISFSEVREYQPGDEIRTIDWNVTARLNHPYVKVFEDERELNIVLMVDASRSSFFGTTQHSKQDLMVEICALLSFSALNNNDKVSVIFFTDQVEKYIPPMKGRSHSLRIIRELINFTPASAKTDVAEALHFLNSMRMHRSVVFLLSDFMSHKYEHALRIAATRHDVVCLRVFDPREHEMPNVGIILLSDAETGESTFLSTSSRKARAAYATQYEVFRRYFDAAYRRSGADSVSISTADDYIRCLMVLFKRRATRA
ncbi:MAG TPA: DUF58 domain-containing protein [Chitinophagales bacterium]|nr:DUF58 domain-containing protein [Chitinophagales bacterium]